ncbi:uncharacterized protein B0H64DRAFT_230662 [Chaetomium fimeti]|uniref:NADH dehydrogenase [ubiquinone] 1 alpha subcomplex subunit 1 n=1 Tax=Chaetomium fimeti TaxID=1854472 RepID=A0AAE0LPB6_9PEZI|nr:hypothetical protein B0H64DRAFT_230662 [Chaetomium fimeti]
MIPFESLLPYGIIIAMFGVTGAGMNKIKNMQSGGKRHRWSVDQWDKQSTIEASYLREILPFGVLTFVCSDGPRQEAYWILARANRQPHSAAGVRIKQPLESK